MENFDQEKLCPLCLRKLSSPFNRHHLKPLSQGGKGTTTIELHKICHDKIHSVFTEKELAKKYNTIEKLRENEEIVKFISWVKSKPDHYYDHSSKMKKQKL